MEYDIESILEMYEDDYNPDPRPMAQEPRNMYNQGQLVQNTVDGSRPGYSGKRIETGISKTKSDKFEVSYKEEHLGTYDTIEEAREIYKFEKKENPRQKYTGNRRKLDSAAEKIRVILDSYIAEGKTSYTFNEILEEGNVTTKKEETLFRKNLDGVKKRDKKYNKLKLLSGNLLSEENKLKIMSTFDLPEGQTEWLFEKYKYGVDGRPNKSGGNELLAKRIIKHLKKKTEFPLAASFSDPKGWMAHSMYRVYKNQTEKVIGPDGEPTGERISKKGVKLTYEPLYGKDGLGKTKITGFKDNTAAGNGKEFYPLKKYETANSATAASWDDHLDYEKVKKMVDITKRVGQRPNDIIQKLLTEKGFKDNVRLNDILSYDRYYTRLSEITPQALLRSQIVKHHSGGVSARDNLNAAATKDIQLLTDATNSSAVRYENIVNGTKGKAPRSLTTAENKILKNMGVKITGRDGTVYGGGSLNPDKQFALIEKQAAEMVKKNTFNQKGFNEYLLKLAGTTNEKCKGALAYGGRVALAEGLSPEFCIGEGKKVARDLVAKNIEGTLAQKNMMGKLMTSVKNFAKSILDPRELFDLKKQFFSKGALMSMPIFDGVMAADDALRKNMDPKEAFAKTFLFGSIPETFGITKGVDVLQAEKMLNNSNLSPAGKAYAQAIIDTDEYKKLSTSSIQTSPEMVNAVQKKLKELENNIAGKQGGRFDYESAIAEMQGTFKAKPKENKFFFDDAPDAPDVTPLKNKLAKKAMTRGPMTAKKNQPVDLTPTTYQNFKPNYGFTKEQFEDVMRKEGVLAKDKIYGNNFYKQEIEKPIEFEQLMEVPGFKGTQNNFSEGGITGLRSKYEYKK